MMPIRSASSCDDILRRAIITSTFTMILIRRCRLNGELLLFLQILAHEDDLRDDHESQAREEVHAVALVDEDDAVVGQMDIGDEILRDDVRHNQLIQIDKGQQIASGLEILRHLAHKDLSAADLDDEFEHHPEDPYEGNNPEDERRSEQIIWEVESSARGGNVNLYLLHVYHIGLTLGSREEHLIVGSAPGVNVQFIGIIGMPC